ncbi:MAG: hypothetical protein BGO51_28420 [Rhodospirillales bacterium 69-11]|nr:hypothetical protein [Rhodospirillales bacterium]MBN8905770.1 hypothetical protein [Rhodospirillales bacterium]MBN8927177.1 hypothetical protein [Rhodospirillales bacterium]OJW25229.1 MAG: hypothetical protein BGO51_28420 [Rhodospirillales bacterium 69-11]
MNWVTFEVEGGGLVKVRAQHAVAIYDEQGSVKLSTIAGGVHLLRGMTVQHAAARITDAADEHRSVRATDGFALRDGARSPP